MTESDKKIVAEIDDKYGSVEKMVHAVRNRIDDLKKYHGYLGRDGADTLEAALKDIPSRFHMMYYKYAH